MFFCAVHQRQWKYGVIVLQLWISLPRPWKLRWAIGTGSSGWSFSGWGWYGCWLQMSNKVAQSETDEMPMNWITISLSMVLSPWSRQIICGDITGVRRWLSFALNSYADHWFLNLYGCASATDATLFTRLSAEEKIRKPRTGRFSLIWLKLGQGKLHKLAISPCRSAGPCSTSTRLDCSLTDNLLVAQR